MASIKLQLLVFTVIFISAIFGEETYPQLLFSYRTAIALFDTKTENISILADGCDHVLFLDYHSSKHYIFWSDYHIGTISRLPYRAGFKSEQEIIIIGANNPTGVAVDSINDYLYWSEMGGDRIHRSHLNGSSTTFSIDVPAPHGLALDISNGLVFCVNSQGDVLKCSLDGGECQVIYTSSHRCDNLVIDFEESKIYWTSWYSSLPIQSSYLNGSNLQKTGITISQAWGIDVSNTHIYYADWNRGLCKTEKANSTYYVLLHAHAQLTALKIFKLEVKFYYFEDECRYYNYLRSANKRSSDYILDFFEDTVLSDHDLKMNWYRVISDNGDMMPTSAPGHMHCGTVNPIWLNGQIFSHDDGNVTKEACIQTKDDICEQKIDIQIKNCGSFYIYYLQHSPVNSSFCFGNGPVLCPDGLSSDTGYYPGCTSSFPKEIVPVNVEADLIDEKHFPVKNNQRYQDVPVHGNQSYSSLLPIFRCNFTDVSEGSYVYDVHWYINEVHVISHLNVPFSNINYTVLRDTDWINIFKMNMEVKCAIRMRYSTDSIPGLKLYSQSYQAGIYPTQYEYTVIEGESIDITFTSSVPVGCLSSHDAIRTHCEQNFYIYQLMDSQTSLSNRNKIAKTDVVFAAQFCGIRIKSVNWKNDKILRVYGFSDSMYNFQDRSTVLKISTSAVSEFNYIWKDIQVPDIKVTVIDKDNALMNRQCLSYNDPHITTFDGRLYHYMDVGEFVMYKNDKGPYSVHALFTNCGFGWVGSSCHCGIAVRSRNSLFVLRTCKTISRTEKYLLQEPMTKFISCDVRDIVIEHDSNNYKITLPIGTEIKFTISRWSKFISMIAIKPSICDINVARGLCGVPSTTKDQSDDFTHRQNGPINNDQEFADSWRITPTMIAEQLFSSEAVFLSNLDEENGNSITENNSTSYCTCARQASNTDTQDDFKTEQCNSTESTDFCSEPFKIEEDTITSFYTSCSTSKRKKRSVNSFDEIVRRSISDDNDDDVIDFPSLTYDESVFNTKVTIPEVFRNGWTEDTARQTCMKEIQNSLPSELTILVDVSVEEFVESCLLDIKLVGDTTFLPDTIGTMLTYIMTEVLRNESLFMLNTTDGSQTLMEYVTSNLCHNNCSDNGNCSWGVCLCNKQYIGDECSQSITIPPSNISLPFDGLCTLGTRDCKSTNIFGDFLSRTVWYKIKYFQIMTESIKYISESDVSKVNFRNMFMVSVDLMHSRRKRTTTDTFMAEGNEIRLSYDGTNFGESATIITYDDSCYSCNSINMSCLELELCRPTVDPITQNDDKKSVVVIAAVLGSLLLFIMVVVGFIYFKANSNNARTKINATPDQQEGKPRVYLDQSNESQLWMTRDKTISDLQLEIDDIKDVNPFEMFEKRLHFVPPPSHYKRNL
ncbi:unnamed protein product [Mytilus coruscus]|uniref:VWFD domain-containing protein n=1 Tax=Mytilus coruscus TaxID=42192 RepID=A0A6J8AP94_MYTCO|nr:unnamed protein product [Mytilus coruscus]